MSDDLWLAGRAGFVTGGASGLGRATALALAEVGARVIVADDQARREALAGAFAEHGEAFDISLSAITVGSGAAAYNGSKAAFAKVTECFQREILEFGWPCRIQGIMPAAMDTPMMERWGIPADRMMPPSDVAAEVLHCLRRPASAYGQNLVVVPRDEPDFPR